MLQKRVGIRAENALSYAARSLQASGDSLLPGGSGKARKHHQLDFHFGMGLTASAVNHFIGIAYSFRFPVLRR